MVANFVRTLVVALGVSFFGQGTEAATFTVSNRNDAGAGSLRQAILDAEAAPGRDTIAFNITGIPPFNIVPTTSDGLPVITDSVVIDGTTQPGYSNKPIVSVVGTSAGAVATGLRVEAANSEIRGLAINRFGGYGIRIQGFGGNVIAGNFLGTSPAGTVGQGNDFGGIAIVSSSNNIIGGTLVSDRNLISANAYGVFITGQDSTGNRVEGNFIGTDVTGTVGLGNLNNGVYLVDATDNVIGGPNAAARNVISGNQQSGVYLLESTTTRNQILGNYIGVNATGDTALSNRVDGVTLYHAPENVIGGNVISGNRERGVSIFGTNANDNLVQGNLIGTDASGRVDRGNRFSGVGITGGSRNIIGGTNAAARNVISGNDQSGVSISDTNSRSNVIIGNFIGLDRNGSNSVANGIFNSVTVSGGVTISDGTENQVGSTNAAARNVISGNALHGIALLGGTNHHVLGNLIGTDMTGRIGRGNGLAGIYVTSAGSMIGGETIGARNIISGNNRDGIFLYLAGASNNVIAGNFIGTDITGTNALANAGGIGVTNAPRNVIGTTHPFGGNLISGNEPDTGIYFQGAQARGNRICGNLIGTDVTGTRALGNSFGGVAFYGAPGNLLGGTEIGSRNVISGNPEVAVYISGATASGNIIQGNFIGTQINGIDPLPNFHHGIDVRENADRTLIGGTVPGAGNRIAYAESAGYDGVRIRNGSVSNLVSRNAIFGNSGLAIDLDTEGPNPNDVNDLDTGANNLQNAPVITSAEGRFITTLRGSLNSRPNSTFTLEFYANRSPDASAFGEGERWIGSATVATASDGNANFVVTLTNRVAAGPYISATATDAANNTSEFGNNVVSAPAGDADGDGLPDDYELAFGLNPNSNADALLDRDGDGATNQAEFLAGTNPNDASSVFRISIEIDDGFRRIIFPTVSGRRYRVEAAENVTGPWSLLEEVAGNGQVSNAVDAKTAEQRFYRVRSSE